ncbi:cyclase family protein [Azospirillum sp.]|uniref:cyclase family protein n=1 Tax=Azospirillum sp. TaxID=34012 RepID=UPI002D530821|nr:cyclase family protein [Azospirillum sp.]HYD71107.1 cyclase family protein [Azospirillum sp.]
MTERWKHRPPGSNWGDFGPDDQIGRLNLITPERRLKAMAEVRTGEVFCLSLPLDLPGGNALHPHRHPPRRHSEERSPGKHCVNFELSQVNPDFVDSVCDDHVVLYLQYSTQWDALAHIGRRFDADGDGAAEIVYYNGYRAGTDILGAEQPGGPAARALGIENMAATGVQGRGVMVDLHGAFGDGRTLVGYDALMRVMEADGVVVEPGDLLCLHTGFARMILEMGGQPDAHALHNSGAVLDGRDERLIAWIGDSGVAALIADNYAVEGYPNPCAHDGPHEALPLHQACLFRLGIHLGELWHLSELNDWLKRHRRSRFLLTAPPLRLPGSFGSPVTPVATV